MVESRSSLALLAVLLVGCASSPGRDRSKAIHGDDDPLARGRLLRNGCNEAGVCLVFALQDECPNWNAALALAKRKAGCGGLGSDDRRAIECRKRFACDVCQFLENETWPPALVRVLPCGKLPFLGHVEGCTEFRDRYTPGSLNTAWIELQRARCFGPGVGIWPFWEDNIEFLAKAMIHESLHLCKIVGGYGPSTVDPTAKVFVNDCF